MSAAWSLHLGAASATEIVKARGKWLKRPKKRGWDHKGGSGAGCSGQEPRRPESEGVPDAQLDDWSRTVRPRG
jgi:hypothetical protein